MRALKALVCTTPLLAPACGPRALDAHGEAEAVRALAGCYEFRLSRPNRWLPTSWLPLDTTRMALQLTSERDTVAYESPAYHLHVPGVDPPPFPHVSFWVPTAHNALRAHRFATDAGGVLRLRRNEHGRLEGIGWSEGLVENEGVRFRVLGEPFPCADTVAHTKSREVPRT